MCLRKKKLKKLLGTVMSRSKNLPKNKKIKVRNAQEIQNIKYLNFRCIPNQ